MKPIITSMPQNDFIEMWQDSKKKDPMIQKTPKQLNYQIGDYVYSNTVIDDVNIDTLSFLHNHPNCTTVEPIELDYGLLKRVGFNAPSSRTLVLKIDEKNELIYNYTLKVLVHVFWFTDIRYSNHPPIGVTIPILHQKYLHELQQYCRVNFGYEITFKY